MKINTLFFISLFFFFSNQSGNAQEQFKTHTVKKGETVYQISRIYKVSIADIYKLNPNSKDIIYVDDVLRIQSTEKINSTTNTTSSNSISTNNSNPSTYTVKTGDTKYGLSKKFGITINSLESQNPHIKNGLQAGHVLKINSSNNATLKNPNQVVKQVNNNTFKSHKVKKGETVYRISKIYNVTISDIYKLNPNSADVIYINDELRIPSSEGISTSIKSQANNSNPLIYIVKKGDTKYGLSKKFNVTIKDLESINPQIIKMLHYGITINVPSNSENTLEEINSEQVDELVETTNKSDLIESDKVEVISKDHIPSAGNYKDLSLTTNKKKENKLLIFLPFTDQEYQEYENDSDDFNIISNQFIKDNLEFYRGAKIAIDSARSLGLNFEIEISKIGNNDSLLLSKVNILESYNIILSPYYQADAIAEYTSNKNIPVVTGVTSSDKKLSNLFEAIPSKTIQKLKLIEYLNSKQGNIILISDNNRIENRNLVSNYIANAKIIEINKRNEISNRKLVSKLNKSKANYIIIDSKRNSVFLNSTNILLKESSKYDVQVVVIESSLIPNSDNISYKRFNVLNLIYPTNNQLSNNVKTLKFFENYKSSFRSEPTQTVLYGFDITFDVLMRIYQSTNFEDTAKKDKTEYLALKFNYEKSELGKYYNNNVLIFNYNKNRQQKEDD